MFWNTEKELKKIKILKIATKWPTKTRSEVRKENKGKINKIELGI